MIRNCNAWHTTMRWLGALAVAVFFVQSSLILYVYSLSFSNHYQNSKLQISISDERSEQAQPKQTNIKPYNEGQAGLKGQLVPINFYQHPMIGVECFYGYIFPNCSCTQHFPTKNRGLTRNSDDCYGPKCLMISSNYRVQKEILGNYSCVLREQSGQAVVDCSHNGNPNMDNLFYFSECNPYVPRPHLSRFLNVTNVLNLIDHEFRFESIDENRHKSIVKCPLKRTTGTYLIGYSLQVDVHVHEISDGFHDTTWVTKVFSCNSTSIENSSPLSSGDKFLQLLLVKNK
ncbi:hypothetical protein FDP41_013583 [Naegleria fowleri]|uniref:Uncharacterized protein n=1 Tax=Naegleria fowleri TaxID=5763 RepID=A0A6A5C4V9_NAEFO|nr:uncharacterized protein FDP41_013583 [Naegleria fowleri]KAF0980369.1 hypothetical protein FDP41_013583 [Naegleria fowleri]CAG4714608.1 unnamed protein product [Naegleria fowleri]